MNNILLITNGFFLLVCLAAQQYFICGPLRERFESRSLPFELDALYRLMSGWEGALVFIGLSLIVPVLFYCFPKKLEKNTAIALFVMSPLLFGFCWAINHTAPHSWYASEMFGTRSVVIGLTPNMPERSGGMAKYFQTYYGR